MDMINTIRRQLRLHADQKTREIGKSFFKEEVNLYGLKTAAVKKIGRESFKEIRKSGKEQVFKFCAELWRSGYLEESCIACDWSYRLRNEYVEKDLKVFTSWLENYVTNWAACDTFCNHTLGAFMELYPDHLAVLKKWAKAKNRWVRRAAAVTLIVPAKKGKFLKEIFEIADLLLLDEDDLVRKGYGWMLKAAAQAHEKQVFEYVLKNKALMPRTALRYAIEKMPQALKQKAMA